MSKICSKCGTTNYDSATICSRCGSLFNDGAYSGTPQPATSGLSDKPDAFKKIDSSTKILAVIISVIVVLVIGLVIFLVVSGSNSNKATDSADNSAAVSSGQQSEENTSEPAPNPNLISGINKWETVAWDNYVEPKSVTITPTTLEMMLGDLTALEAAVSPAEAYQGVIWMSSDEEIAIVYDNGEVEAVGTGVCYIYAFAESASEPGEIYGVCKITVKEEDLMNELYRPDSSNMSDYGEYYVDVDDFLTLRYGPSVKYGEILKIQPNEIVSVYAFDTDEKGNPWAYVECYGETGWVSYKYLVAYSPEDDVAQ